MSTEYGGNGWSVRDGWKECPFGVRDGEVTKDASESGVIKAVTWNVAGYAKLREAKDFLEKFDIVLVQETWVEKAREEYVLKQLNKAFEWWAKAAVRVKKRS